MGAAQWLVLAVALLRLAELVHAGRNAGRLLPVAGSSTALATTRCWSCCTPPGWSRSFRRPARAASRPFWLMAFLALLAARAWTLWSLGPYWSTRVITLPEAPLVRRGPYLYLRHPNYAIVVGEIAVLPLIFGAWRIALLFSVLNGALLWHRIRVENRALAPRRSAAASEP